ncbi:MAG: bifunctional methylenetetrahydrofolate dehydrogenase/methenyltetrahydrofolate cyclohydrolase FolD [Thermoguttaceae bacterium]|nr:bifunctional methylenetetrahydrofolate dehydrogenase/methenyltetrahydrofolate cyclohydrolase FolD [Thermoguttaceae bacterium]MBR5757445.1 bifunctional methylenetetrahydrofolate dehydrogenase/methenyltetrahydrofolate cyclohydrolase FolD [Thermoguttaceae bacterium]
MAAQILDGKGLAQKIRAEIKVDVEKFVKETNIQPALAVVLVGDNEASKVYVRNKEKACNEAGIKSLMYRLPAETSSEELLKLVRSLNDDASVHGILVQLPLPDGIDEQKILDAIDPEKDVDSFHPENVGLVSQGRPRFLPCTPYGIQQLLVRYNIETKGKRAVVIGRSDIVGKPMGMLLLQKGLGGDATVTICHSRTSNLGEIAKQADILVAAIGKPEFVTADMVKPGAVVVDVGMNKIKKEIVDENGEKKLVDKLVGDVDFDSVKEVAGWITPVPGGVGPLTVTMLLHNALTGAKRQTAK